MDTHVTMLTLTKGMLGGTVVVQGQEVTVPPFNVNSERSGHKLEKLLRAKAIEINSKGSSQSCRGSGRKGITASCIIIDDLNHKPSKEGSKINSKGDSNE